jgi:uncharacterized protein
MGKIWALADFHLSFGAPAKNMDVFGPAWHGYAEKIEKSCKELIAPEDLLLIAGDISWAMKLEEAKKDLDWIERLPGIKLMIRGNHDYWWSSKSKVQKILGPSCQILQNSAYVYEDVAITGTRLWDCPDWTSHESLEAKETNARIWERELSRLELGLSALEQAGKKKRIVMLHYPPTTTDLVDTQVTKLLEKASVDVCVFGHLHALQPGKALWGKKEGVSYYLTSSDYLSFRPIHIEI